jgi:hypothetical protein
MTFLFNDEEFYPMIRYQEFTLKDFMSYAGGLLGGLSSWNLKNFQTLSLLSGLFAGISVMSIIELFYFFTMRLATDILRWIRE